MIRKYLLDLGTSLIADGIASVAIIANGTLKSVIWATGSATETDGQADVFLAKNAATAATAVSAPNGIANNLIDTVSIVNLITTSGVNNSAVNVQRMLNEPLRQGDTLTISGVGTGAVTGVGNCILLVEEKN